MIKLSTLPGGLRFSQPRSTRSPESRFSRLSGPRRVWALVAVVAGAAAIAVAVVLLWPHQAMKQVTVYFPETTGLYTGDSVLVLGVPVGKVESITPQDGRVKVEMSYEASVRLPAGAEAAIIAPTLVTTRSVQLTPGYTKGAVMADDAVIPESRTAVPVEWDQIEKELNTLATTLGPQSGSSGALNKLLNTTASNLNGQGQNMHNTLAALTQASTTLSDDRGDLFATLDNLEQFIAVLQQANGQVGTFEQQLSSVSGTLADNKQELAEALASLNSSLGTVKDFVQSNNGALTKNLASANSVVGNLAASDQTIANILQIAPTEVANFNDIYDPVDHAITGALALTNLSDPAEFVCSTLFDLGSSPAECQQALEPFLKLLQTDQIPVSVDPVNRNGYGDKAVPAGSSATSSSSTSSSSSASTSSSTSGAGSDSGSSGLVNLLLGGS